MAYVGGRMKIDHCLFGYDDGHRLLASSLPLGEETAFLTELSDLAPGVVFGGSKGYWTGLPVPSIGRYVLMYTWPAPEMPRPGCVWTHALLLQPTLLESVADLSVLQNLIIRPSGFLDRELYRKPFEANLLDKSEISTTIDDAIVRKLIDALYGKITTSVEVSSPDELDRPLFAVWSQQWPRLRRNFRFQTAASRAPRPTSSARFDVTAVIKQDEYNSSSIENDSSYWLSSAVKDVYIGPEGPLRKFLWKYGRDVRKQRGSFKPLAEVYTLDDDVQEYSVQSIINIVFDAFSAPNDACYLKQDLVDGVLANYVQVKLVKFLILSEEERNEVFPNLTTLGITNLKNLWPQHAEALLKLVTVASDSESSMSRMVFQAIIETIQTPEFWPNSYSYHDIRKLIVKLHPEFLYTSQSILEDATLIDLLPFVPMDSVGLVSFIRNLMRRNNENLVDAVFDNFPNVSAVQIVKDLNSHQELPNIWKKGLLSRHNLLLQTNVLGHVSHTKLLYEFADSLGWLSNNVIAAGIEPWYSSIIDVSNDIYGAQEDMLNCFFVALSLNSNGDEGLYVIEHYYIELHQKILKSKLSPRAREMLFSQLPELGWLRDWDLGYRFRLAVAKAYVRNKWPIESYANLTSDKKIRDLLADAVSDVEGGREFSNAIWR
ncbi:GAP1-N1 domain-containing protein [Lelliottia wanjuensis]|uniref:GAP1-N1 domain-containing protein n=1 Tax=Lelliottia wanjuensis TaxID=3050585 RepID=UPI00255175A1|nr:hypothetical protein [Lelliottia sp. V86_10]MDK9585738.1 hypothetical protein [Lelliottia sp. V86_10]